MARLHTFYGETVVRKKIDAKALLADLKATHQTRAMAGGAGLGVVLGDVLKDVIAGLESDPNLLQGFLNLWNDGGPAPPATS